MNKLSTALTLALALVGSAHANLLTNPSFEAVDASASPYYIRSFASTPGWAQFGDGVDLIHNNYTQGPPVLVDASDGVQFLDMNQARLLGGIRQEVAVTAGTTYQLSLDTTAWATNARGGTLGYELYDPASGNVLAGGSYTDGLGGTWTTIALSAVATSDQLGVRIQGLGATQAGMGLDNVVLAAAVPEPSTWALFGSGMVMLLGAAARRKRA